MNVFRMLMAVLFLSALCVLSGAEFSYAEEPAQSPAAVQAAEETETDLDAASSGSDEITSATDEEEVAEEEEEAEYEDFGDEE